MAAQEPIIMDNDADLTLIVDKGDRCKTFRVHSHAFSVASPEFRRMLSGDLFGLRSANQRNPPDVLVFPQDTHEGFTVILGILHHKFEDNVDASTLEGSQQLFFVVRVTSKYNLAHLLKPYAAKWIDQLKVSLETFIEESTWRAMCLAIGRELGSEDVVTRCLKQIVLTMSGEPWLFGPDVVLGSLPNAQEANPEEGNSNIRDIALELEDDTVVMDAFGGLKIFPIDMLGECSPSPKAGDESRANRPFSPGRQRPQGPLQQHPKVPPAHHLGGEEPQPVPAPGGIGA